MGRIYERRTACGTPEFTLDYTKDHTYYLSIVAYGEWNTQEFQSEEKLDSWLKDIWYFTDDDVKELKDCMYRYDEV